METGTKVQYQGRCGVIIASPWKLPQGYVEVRWESGETTVIMAFRLTVR